MIELNGTASIARNIAEARQKNGANINIDTEHMLKHCATEVVEAMEAYANRYEFGNGYFEAELADIVSCVLIIAAQEHINIEQAILDCTEKNRKRANKQGDKL